MIDEIINQIKIACDEAEVDVLTFLLSLVRLQVKVVEQSIRSLYQKQQNDRNGM
jgi:arginine decarboxylase